MLVEVSDGVRSVAEAKARRLLLRSGLPAPLWNVKLFDQHGRFLATPDAWFDDVGLAWEIDSLEWHLDPELYARTLDRTSAMMAEDVVVMHTLPSRLMRDGPQVLDELRRTYRNAARRPRPAVFAVPPGWANGAPVQ